MNWLLRALRGRAMESDLDKELRFQVESYAADLIARGVPPAESRRQAQLELGGVEQVKEACRDARGTRWLADLAQDFRFGLRLLRQNPAFTAVAVGTLALGIGGATVMFTVIDSLLLKPLPYGDPSRLLSIYGRTPTWNTAIFGEQNLSYPDFLDIQRGARSIDLAGWFFNPGILSDPGEAEYVTEYDASANLFSVAGVPLFRGRPFSTEEDRPGGAPVAILGYSLWQRRFAGRADAIGSTVTLNGQRYSVIGVAAKGFRLGDDEGDIYTPLGQNTQPILQRRVPHPVGAIARLRPGVTANRARAELAAMGANLASRFPNSNGDRTFAALELRPNVGKIGSTLWLLLGGVTLVLLIACANIGSLMLARASARDRELAMRAALGAGRGRLMRQCLTESGVLAWAGGVLGMGLAAIGIRPFVALWPGQLPRAQEIAIDWRVLLFAVAASLGSGLLFGLAPALRAPARQLDRRLRAGGRVVGGASRLHSAFVVSEIALAMVLLVSAAMIGRTVMRLSTVDSGVDIHNVLTARMALSSHTLADPERIRAAWREALERARAVPGVEGVAAVDTVPLRPGNNQIPYSTSAAPVPDNQRRIALATSVTPDYFHVMRMPLQEGRFFDQHDTMESEPVAIIDTVLAQAAFPEQDPIGKPLWIGIQSGPARVVGVVRHVRYWGPAGDHRAQVRAQVYYPFAQVPDSLQRRWSELMSISVRTRVDPMALLEPLRRALAGPFNDQVIYEVQTMEQIAAASLAQQRFLLQLFAIFASLALGLACIGIYGVLSYLTSRRIPEIGVRMAMGAGAGEVAGMVLRQSLAMTAAGIAAGTASALGAGAVLTRIVDGMQSSQPATYAITAAVLIGAASAAAFVPARNASRVDPMTALRQE